MKRFYIITRRNILIAISVIIALIVAIVIYSSADVLSTAAGQKRLPIYSVERQDKKVAISFDAAWGADDTPELLKILEKYHVKATFFLVGQWVDKYPEMVKALAEAGHDIENHSDTHPHLSTLSREKAVADIRECNRKIEAITGRSPTLIRPPYGDYNNMVIDAVDGMGMQAVQWSIDSLDWKDLSAEQIQNRVLPNIKAGDIVLFHNAAKHTPEALPKIIETLQGQGYTIVPVKELVYPENYTVDHTGKQILQANP